MSSLQNKRQNYHIISLIGKGAYGQVYKARKKQTGQFVAIKTIKKKGKQQKDIKAMRQQIAILKKLKHPNIIVLLDSFQTAAEFIIVTELGQGELFNIIEDDQFLEQPEIRKVAQQLVRALHYIHSNRITHRDLKPQNILMTSQGNIKLCDFGFARYMSYKTQVLTSLKGTPLYMAPQVVQEQPYTHTADLWSLGVILYELSTGSPPFSAANLLTLVEHITKDPVRYPDAIQGDFKNLLKGLLNKDPNVRLGWPDLLNHPFIRETEQEKVERKQKIDKFSNWIQQNHYIQQDENTLNASNNTKSITQSNFDQKTKQIFPIKPGSQTTLKSPICSDKTWNNYIKLASQQRGANQLRIDAEFLDKILVILSGNANQIMRNREQKNMLQIALRVLTHVLMKSKTPENKNADISKKLNIPNYLLILLKTMLRLDGGKNYVQIISDITKLIGLLAKITFNKNIGIQMVYIRSFLPILSSLLSCACSGSDIQYQTLTMNLLRTIGIFANNAPVHYLKSFSFYKDIVEIKFVPEFILIFKYYSDNINVHKLLVQVISAFMHPVFGDIQCFPWKRVSFNGVIQYKEFSTMLECVKQSIINGLLELDWMVYFQRILQLQDESSILPKISISRIILQSLRQSKQFAENLLTSPNRVLKNIFTLLSHSNPIVYSTNCLTVSHILKYVREKKKQENFLDKQYLSQSTISLLCNRIQNQQNKNNGFYIFGSLIIIQQLICKTSINLNSLINFLISEKIVKIICNYLSHSQKSKLQQMRNIEGSNYGIHANGYYDPAFLCYHRLFMKLQKDDQQSFTHLHFSMTNSHLQVKLSDIMCRLSSKSDISPRGMIAYLMLIYDLASNKFPNEFLHSNLLRNLIDLLKEDQVNALAEWPPNFGGGQTCLQILLGTLMNTFLMYLQHTEKQNEILRSMFQNVLIERVLKFVKHLNCQTIPTVITFMSHLLSFSNQKTNFVMQFIQLDGMSLYTLFHLLSSQQYQSSSLIQSCNLLSQIARFSKQTYPHIDSINPYNNLKNLLKSNDSQVKSRALHLIGNMCRHSNFFYQQLAKYDLVKEIAILCNSEDKTTRKYACIALGNAGFHDQTLYPQLKVSIPLLVSLLKDSDEKTRSNAAAALGNLARNSDELDADFVNADASYQLINMLVNDKSLSAKRVSIMAIINLLGLKQSSKKLKSLNIANILNKYIPPNFTSDVNLIKTAQKALDKLE